MCFSRISFRSCGIITINGDTISGEKHGYHPLTFGLYLDQIVRHADPQKRSLSKYFAQEIAQPFGITCLCKLLPSVYFIFSCVVPRHLPSFWQKNAIHFSFKWKSCINWKNFETALSSAQSTQIMFNSLDKLIGYICLTMFKIPTLQQVIIDL